MNLRRLFFLFNIIAIMTLLIQGGYTQNGQAASTISQEGTFLVLWGDGSQGSGSTRTAYFLGTSQDNSYKLIIDDELIYSLGGPISLNRKTVDVTGMWQVAGQSILVQTISMADREQAGTEGIYGPQPWVSVLCKFKDITAEPNDLSYFNQMYSSVYPGLDHFWRQNSYDLANLQGSGAFGWYTLPKNRAEYLPGGNLDFDTAAKDCTAAADPYVDFTPYVGINLMFNDNLDCCAWGGSWYLCLDGICQNWRMTWEPPWGYQNIGVIAHETGHGFGLPHSLGNCMGGYDNRWDVLSDVWSNGSDPTWGTLGQHTISYHKEMVEWITSDQMFTSKTGSIKTITLERLALPQSENYLGARILINDLTNYFYTLEVRQPTNNPVDYDKWLPGFAVIIHNVITSRPEPAVVIDQDGDCNTGDAGAMYTSGEVFTDADNGISVTIDGSTPTGYVVTINNQFITMDNVDITGAEQGYVDESIPFTATVSPVDATTPITYTWEATNLPPVQHLSDTIDSIELSWDEVGSKAITVTASNPGGSVVATHIIDIESKVPLVTITGPMESKVGELNEFTATALPPDVVQPITYTWQASGQMPITNTTGLSDTVSYSWYSPGTQVITVTAENLEGSTTDTFSLPVRMPPVGFEVSGPAMGGVDESYLFIATVNPITTTLPITYIWTVDDQLPVTHTTGITDTLMIRWDEPGIHQISVIATNPAGSVADVWAVTIYIRQFLPLGMRN